MLIAFFTITEPTSPALTPQHETMLCHLLTGNVPRVWNDTVRMLCQHDPYAHDGGTPYGQVYVGEFRRDGGLSSAREICEKWRPGEGILVGLVIEGTASGPLYAEPGVVGVLPRDVDTTLTGTFARNLQAWVEAVLPGYALDPQYHVSDWSFYERSSDLMSWASA